MYILFNTKYLKFFVGQALKKILNQTQNVFHCIQDKNI